MKKSFDTKCDIAAIALLIVAIGAILLGCAGCGHNAVQYGDGVGFDFGVSPENCSLSFNLRYGKILSAVTRDNVEIEMTGKANADGSTSSADTKSATGTVATDGNLKVKIGRQINGAAVDLVKAGADADKVIDALKENDKETKESEAKK